MSRVGGRWLKARRTSSYLVVVLSEWKDDASDDS